MFFFGDAGAGGSKVAVATVGAPNKMLEETTNSAAFIRETWGLIRCMRALSIPASGSYAIVNSLTIIQRVVKMQ